MDRRKRGRAESEERSTRKGAKKGGIIERERKGD